LNYYPHHIGDYAKDTAHLSMHEDGAYRRLLDLYYSTEKPLPTDHAKLYRLVRAFTKQDKQAVDTMLAEFFSKQDDGYRHKRCDAELAKAHAKSEKARESAGKRWQSDGNANAYANASTDAMRSHSEGNAPNNQEPIANNQKPKKDIPPTAVAAPEPDPIFGHCLQFLLGKGCGNAGARSFLGASRRDYGDVVVCEVISLAEKQDVSNPIPWITKVLQSKQKINGSGGKRSAEPDFSTLNYREGISEDGRF
jgi:uncharacterized protein YdaU (DUF1376 family)